MNLTKNFEVKLPISVVPLYSDEKFNLVRVEYEDIVGSVMQIFHIIRWGVITFTSVNEEIAIKQFKQLSDYHYIFISHSNLMNSTKYFIINKDHTGILPEEKCYDSFGEASDELSKINS